MDEAKKVEKTSVKSTVAHTGTTLMTGLVSTGLGGALVHH